MQEPHEWLDKGMQKHCIVNVTGALKPLHGRNFNLIIAVMNAKMAEMPLTTRYAPTRWKKGLNIMLQKQTGNLNVKKLRMIVLIEADFNMNNKWLGRAIMLPNEQKNWPQNSTAAGRKIQQTSKASTKDYFMTQSILIASQQPYAATMQKAAMTG